MNKYFLLSKKIGYNFKEYFFLEEALTHPSRLGMGPLSARKSYEQLEFLGDAVLAFIVTDFLIKNFPEETEGELTKRRAGLINSETICHIGREIEILNYLEAAGSVEEFNKIEASKIIEDTTEALLGAIYLDGGIEGCRNFIMKYWEPFLFKEVVPDDDPKTYLQEWSQKKGFGIPKYNLVSKSGEAHAPIFTIAVKVADLPSVAAASSSKKFAEKEAARALMKYIKTNYNDD